MVAVLLLHSVHGDTEQLVRNPRARQYPAPSSFTAFTPVTKAGAQTKVRKDFTITEKAPTRAFSWLKVANTTFTFKTLLRQYAKWALTLW